MRGMGVALMGIGHGSGDGASVKAMKAAIESKLLEENSIKGARGALINIPGSKDMPLDEIEEAISLINEEADEDANIIFGTVFDEGLNNEVKVTVSATGFDHKAHFAMPGTDSQNVQYAPKQTFSTPETPKRGKYEVPTFIRRQAD